MPQWLGRSPLPFYASPQAWCAVRSHYHAAMTQQEREEVQANWTHDRMQIIVATIAFGMGERHECPFLAILFS